MSDHDELNRPASRLVIPFDTRNPKTRLSTVLSPVERREFAHSMLTDVLTAVERVGVEPTIVAPDPVSTDAPVIVDDRPLTDAVNGMLEESNGVAIVMADLALVTAESLTRLLTTTGDVVIAPGNGGGTNALVVRHDDFSVSYHNVSFRTHRRHAATIGAQVSVVDSFTLGTDIDRPKDLIEVLIHNEGAAEAWLRNAGFAVGTGASGRVILEQDGCRVEPNQQVVGQ